MIAYGVRGAFCVFFIVFCFAFFYCEMAHAEDGSYKVFKGEKVNFGKTSSGKCVYTSDNETVATIDEDGILTGENAGQAVVRIKEKRWFKNDAVRSVVVNVFNGATLQIKPTDDTWVGGTFDLCDESRSPIESFSLNDEVQVFPGTYYIHETTSYSSFSDGYTKVTVTDGERKVLSTMFSDSTTLTFSSDDEELNGVKIDLWKSSNKKFRKYKTVEIQDGKAVIEGIRYGNYCWAESTSGERKIHPPTSSLKPVEVYLDGNKTEAYPFGINSNPLTMEVHSVSSNRTTSAVEQVNISEDTMGNMKKVYDDLTSLGCSDICACAIIGNMYGESGVRASAVENGGGGHGLCQWTGGRWTKLKEYAESQGKKWTDIDVQIDYLVGELNGMKMDSFWNAQTIEEATEIFMRKFERPAEYVYETSLPRRIGAANDAYRSFVGE